MDRGWTLWSSSGYYFAINAISGREKVLASVDIMLVRWDLIPHILAEWSKPGHPSTSGRQVVYFKEYELKGLYCDTSIKKWWRRYLPLVRYPHISGRNYIGAISLAWDFVLACLAVRASFSAPGDYDSLNNFPVQWWLFGMPRTGVTPGPPTAGDVALSGALPHTHFLLIHDLFIRKSLGFSNEVLLVSYLGLLVTQ